MHRSTENIARLVQDRYVFQYPSLKDHYPDLPDEFYNDMVIVFQDPDQFKAEVFQKYPIEQILSYLRITHKFYIEKRLGEIEQAIELLNSIENKEVNNWYPYLANFIKGFNQEMLHHIQEEEKTLFPYIDVLLVARKSKVLNYTPEQKICLLSFMLDHDDEVEEELHKLIISLDQISESFKDSFSFRMLLNHLKTFELDLRIHARMEEEVLIPRCILLEKEILKDTSIRVSPSL